MWVASEAVEVFVPNQCKQHWPGAGHETWLGRVWPSAKVEVLKAEVIEHTVIKVYLFQIEALIRAKVVPRLHFGNESLLACY